LRIRRHAIFIDAAGAASHDRSVWRFAILVAASCSASYTPGMYGSSTGGVSFPCLDVSVAGTRRIEATGPIVVYYLGNRCEHSVRVDLATPGVIGGDDVGRTVRMVPYDPDRELEIKPIDARMYGEEWIEYQPTEPIDHIDWLDVDVGGVEADASQHPRWLRARVVP
jgi:hypothetical protein